MMLAATSSMMPHVQSGRLRGLAVGSVKRSASAPGLPTIAELDVPSFGTSLDDEFGALRRHAFEEGRQAGFDRGRFEGHARGLVEGRSDAGSSILSTPRRESRNLELNNSEMWQRSHGRCNSSPPAREPLCRRGSGSGA